MDTYKVSVRDYPTPIWRVDAMWGDLPNIVENYFRIMIEEGYLPSSGTFKVRATRRVPHTNKTMQGVRLANEVITYLHEITIDKV